MSNSWSLLVISKMYWRCRRKNGERFNKEELSRALNWEKDWQDVYVYSKVGNHSQGRPEGSLFNSFYTKV